MARTSKRRWEGRVYLGQDESGRERYEWVGRFPTKRERDGAVARRKLELADESAQARLPAGERVTVAEYADLTLVRKVDGRLRTNDGRPFKDSSLDTERAALRAFKAAFADRPLASIERHEAIAWAERSPAGAVAVVVTLFNRAVDEEVVDRNPFRGLGRRGRGRSDQDPPTVDEFERLLDACDALDDYAPQMRALLVFGAYTGMRPGELFALEWSDIDFAANRVQVQRRVYKGRVDLPKSNQARTIALPPPARDVLLGQPTRSGDLVFRSKRGDRLSQATLSGYWSQVKARAALDFDFYLATKHYGVHLLYRLGLSTRAIGAQMGWSEGAVEKLLRVYGHIDLVALGEVDKLYERQVVPLRSVRSA